MQPSSLPLFYHVINLLLKRIFNASIQTGFVELTYGSMVSKYENPGGSNTMVCLAPHFVLNGVCTVLLLRQLPQTLHRNASEIAHWK